MDHHNNSRRQFLRNTSLAALAITALPLGLQGKGSSSLNVPMKTLDCDPTTLDFYGTGPFYTENPPSPLNNLLAPLDEPGTRLIITGRVINLECEEFIADTIVDVWHASDEGQYDNVGYSLRGKFLSNDQGFYLFETILPGKYLNGSRFRPAHIHFKITPPGFTTLTTQLYFAGDTDIPGDAAASITEGQYDATDRIIELTEDEEGRLTGNWDIVINGNGEIINGTNDIHIDRGMIYEIGPNPFQEKIDIRYGVFKTARIGLVVYDEQGREVAVLEDRELTPAKYDATWAPEQALPAGHYFVVLRVNGKQVSYEKVMRG
jgi:protocatechuate 3,4-dioxygenase beta subunit